MEQLKRFFAKCKNHDSSTLRWCSGPASDIAIHAEETLKIRARLNQILAKHTGQSEEVIAKDTDRDNFMSADKAHKYGIVDKILDRRDEKSKK